jgi:hypothetical protein
MTTNNVKRILDSANEVNDEPEKKKVPLDDEIELVDSIELVDDVPVESEIEEYSIIEKNVGICEYVNPDVFGVFGIVKQRYWIRFSKKDQILLNSTYFFFIKPIYKTFRFPST